MKRLNYLLTGGVFAASVLFAIVAGHRYIGGEPPRPSVLANTDTTPETPPAEPMAPSPEPSPVAALADRVDQLSAAVQQHARPAITLSTPTDGPLRERVAATDAALKKAGIRLPPAVAPRPPTSVQQRLAALRAQVAQLPDRTPPQ